MAKINPAIATLAQKISKNQKVIDSLKYDIDSHLKAIEEMQTSIHMLEVEQHFLNEAINKLS